MKEMTMLDLARIDLSTLVEALDDHTDETSWWLDPRTGEVEPWSEYLSSEAEETHPGDRDLIPIEPTPSGEGYRDMEDFIERVHDPHAKDLLSRAIAGRGAFRRFKDTLFEFPDLRQAWFAFRDARAERRALRWLADEGLIDTSLADREIALRLEPEVPAGGAALDIDALCQGVTNDLRELYGTRLRRLVLFGSWARRDAHPESDLDFLVVLDRVASVWEELRRMDPVLWRHSYANETVVTATPVSEADVRAGRWPLLRRAMSEGRDVA